MRAASQQFESSTDSVELVVDVGGAEGAGESTTDDSPGDDGAAAAAAHGSDVARPHSHSSSSSTRKSRSFVTYTSIGTDGPGDSSIGDRWAAARMGKVSTGATVRPQASYSTSWTSGNSGGGRAKIRADEAHARQTLSRATGLANNSRRPLAKAVDADTTLSSIRGKRNAVRAKLEIISGGNREFESELLEKLYHEEKLDKVVAYVTTLDAVRKPYDDCNALLKLMALLRLKVQVKNVYLEPRFKKELEERAPGASVPQLFVKSYCVGGLDAAEQLNDSGELGKLTIGCSKQTGAGKCPTCGGFGYTVCSWCQGSMKSRSHGFTEEAGGAFLSCTVCNTNGLVQCKEC